MKNEVRMVAMIIGIMYYDLIESRNVEYFVLFWFLLFFLPFSELPSFKHEIDKNKKDQCNKGNFIREITMWNLYEPYENEYEIGSKVLTIYNL